MAQAPAVDDSDDGGNNVRRGPSRPADWRKRFIVGAALATTIGGNHACNRFLPGTADRVTCAADEKKILLDAGNKVIDFLEKRREVLASLRAYSQKVPHMEASFLEGYIVDNNSVKDQLEAVQKGLKDSGGLPSEQLDAILGLFSKIRGEITSSHGSIQSLYWDEMPRRDQESWMNECSAVQPHVDHLIKILTTRYNGLQKGRGL